MSENEWTDLIIMVPLLVVWLGASITLVVWAVRR